MVFYNRPLAELIDSLNSNFGIIGGLGHGDINHIRVRNNPRENATNHNFDALINSNFPLMYVITCYTNTFDSDCLGEHWLLNPHGGGIAYIGPSAFSEAYLHEEYTTIQLDSLFEKPLAGVVGIAKVPFIGSSNSENWYRLYQLAINYLGDPTILLWDSIPQFFNNIAISPDTLWVGMDTVTILVDPGVDPSSFSVILYKPGEVFIRDSTQTGRLDRGLETETDGYLYCTVMSDGYVMYRDSLLVRGLSGYCDYRGHVVVDTLGNGNGVVNPGEEIGLRVEVGNGGGGVCSGVWVRLMSYDSMVVVLSDSVWYGDIVAGGLVLGMPFGVRVGAGVSDGSGLLFGLELHGSFGVVLDSFQVMCYGADILHFGQVHGGVDTVWVM